MKTFVYRFLARCARRYLARTRPYIIGVTGSVGKTTCRMIITQLLQKSLPHVRIDTSEKNFNSEIGLCLAILGIGSYTPTPFSTVGTLFTAFFQALMAPPRADVFVLEYGIDHPGDMQQLLSIASPNMAIMTSVDLVHAAYFQQSEEIFDEKVQLLYAASDIAFWAHPLEPYMSKQEFSGDILSFALHEDDNETDIGFNAYTYRRVDEQVGSEFIVCQGEDRMVQIRTNLVGHEHAGYISLGYEVAQIIALRLGVSFDFPTGDVLSFSLQPGRMSRLLGKWGSILLDSTYNASPGSMRMMITTITQIRQELFPERQLICCLGDMRELGDFTEQEHKKLATELLHVDRLFLCGESMQKYCLPELHELGYPASRVSRYEDSSLLGEAVEGYLSTHTDLSLVLFKGSQNTIFLEEAVKILLRNSEDYRFLCRQGDRRQKKKQVNTL